MAEIIASYADDAGDGIEARVTNNVRGYAVTIYDLDAEETVGFAKVYPSFEQADQLAQAIASGREVTE